MSAKKTSRLRRIQWIAVAFLTAAGIINYLDRSALSIANTAIREEMGLTPTQMGLLLSAFSLAYAFSQLPVGAMLDRFGARIMLGAGMFFWSLAQVVCGFVNNLSQFLVARAILGVGEAPQYPAAAKVVSEWFNVRERGTPTGIIIASSCIGPCIAPPVLTVMLLAFSWRWMFIITGVLGVIVAIGWYLVFRDRSDVQLSHEEAEHLDEGLEKVPSDQRMTAKEWRSLFGYESTWGIILGFMGVIYMVWLYLTWLPSYLEHERGLTVALTGWVVAIPYVFGTIGMLCAGQVADRLLRHGLSLVASRKWPVCVGLLAISRQDYAALRTLSGVAPVTKRSGKSCIVTMRYAAQVRLRNAVFHWARVAVLNDPTCRRRYAALRARGHSYGRALRGVADRLLGVACVLLQRGMLFDPDHGTPTAPQVTAIP